jgi:serine/threonine-protein kinase CTR1
VQIGFSHKLILPLVFHVEEKILKLPLLLTAVIAGTVDDGAGPGFVMNSKQIDRTGPERNNLVQFPSNTNEISKLPRQLKVNHISGLDKAYNPSQNAKQSMNEVRDPIPLKKIPPVVRRDIRPLISLSDASKDSISEGSQLVSGKTSKELSLDVEDLDIPWSDLVLKERIGAGMFLDRVGKENMTMVY